MCTKVNIAVNPEVFNLLMESPNVDGKHLQKCVGVYLVCGCMHVTVHACVCVCVCVCKGIGQVNHAVFPTHWVNYELSLLMGANVKT